MRNLNFSTPIGVSGLYTLLLFLFLSTIICLRYSKYGKRFGPIDFKKKPTDQILLTAALHLIFITICCFAPPFFKEPSDISTLRDLYFQISISWNILLMTIPLLRSGTFLAQTSLFGILVTGTSLVSALQLTLFFFGIGGTVPIHLHFLIVFILLICAVLAGLKHKKRWKETFLIVNNLYFLISLFLYLFGCVLYSLIINGNSTVLSYAMNIGFTLLIATLMVYWFYFQEKRLLEYNMYKIPAINKQITNILYEEEPDGGAYTIKGRLYSLFENEKPYLSSDLTISDLAEMLYTNKSNLSKILNNSLNVNFNEFVNSYRVKEAIRVFKEDHNTTLQDLCKKSGFRNISSFNNAFKLYTGSTPGEWCRKIKKEETANEDMEKDF